MSICFKFLVYLSLQLLVPGIKALQSDGQGYTYDTRHRKIFRNVDTVLPKVLHFDVKDGKHMNSINLRRNDNVDINKPLCYSDAGETVCEYGKEKNVAFYHSHDQSGAFSVMSETTSNTYTVEGDLIINKELFKLDPGGPLSNMMVNKTAHYITKRSIYGYHSERRMIHLERMSSFRGNHGFSTGRDHVPGQKYTVEVLILVDYSLYRKFFDRNHGDHEATMTKLKYYFAHIVNGMDLRYTSIDKKGFGVNIRLAGFYVARNASDLPFIITYRQGGDERSKVDGGTTLLDLTNFLRGKNAQALPHYDHAMLFTEYDATNGRGYILGTSYLSGICTPMSTSVIVDHGSYNSAGIAAHELGHNLGVVYHDGDYAPVARSCPKELNYIMAPSSAIISNETKDFSFKFSECSISQIERQIKKLNRRKNCLAEDPGPSFATLVVKPYLAIPPGQMEDVHEQCKQIYGEQSFMCPPASPDEMCYKMYCYNPERRICITASEQRAALGTSCGDKKWCKLGRCVLDIKAPTVPADCPFPDVPPPRASCREEASPFRCENDAVFYRRCCQSCSRNFTEEEKCKDSKILINGLRCADFMKAYGSRVCEFDPNVRNYCCKSCKLARSQNQERPKTTISSNLTCKDNTYVRINGLDCATFVLVRGKRVCNRPMVKSHCCFSCL